MKTKIKKPVRDPLVRKIVNHLKKQGVKCGYGDQMEQVRKLR